MIITKLVFKDPPVEVAVRNLRAIKSQNQGANAADVPAIAWKAMAPMRAPRRPNLSKTAEIKWPFMYSLFTPLIGDYSEDEIPTKDSQHHDGLS